MTKPHAVGRLSRLRRRVKRYPSERSDWRDLPVSLDQDQLLIGGWQVMQRWEAPLMDALACEVTRGGGDILEVGFGMGISATAIIAAGCRSYTVIEAHPEVAANAREWGQSQPVPVTVLEGFWQDVEPQIEGQYDGILFDTYPLSRKERNKNHYPFIPRAPRLLRPNGVLTLYSDETSRFRQEHLELLLAHFNEVKLVKVSDLHPPDDCEYWQSTTMVIPVACNRLDVRDHAGGGDNSDGYELIDRMRHGRFLRGPSQDEVRGESELNGTSSATDSLGDETPSVT